MTTTISFASRKGGAGKTIASTNVAMGFVMHGANVLFIDLLLTLTHKQQPQQASVSTSSRILIQALESFCTPHREPATIT